MDKVNLGAIAFLAFISPLHRSNPKKLRQMFDKWAGDWHNKVHL